jgi:uncharacterized protein with HEPN domain
MRDPHEESHEQLQHISEAIINIEKYVRGESAESFCEKDILHDVVLMQFIIIGEAIIHVENGILDRYDYPWYKVRSLRHMIAHEYFNIKLIAVWEIIENELAGLKEMIDNVLMNEFSGK